MDTTVNGDITTEFSLDSSKEADDSLICPGSLQCKNEDISETNCENSELSLIPSAVEKVTDDGEFQDAAQFFRNEHQLEYLENIRTSNQNSWLTRNSLGKSFDPLFKTLDPRSVEESGTVRKLFEPSLPLPDIIETVSQEVESVDPNEDSSNIVDQKLSSINGPILTPTRESIGNLINFVSPMKKQRIDYFDSPNTSEAVLYTEEEVEKLVKLQELKYEEAFIRKQRHYELKQAIFLKEKDNVILLLKQIISSLRLVLQEVFMLFQNLVEEKQIFKEKLEALQISKREGIDDLKSLSQNFLYINKEVSNLKDCHDVARDLLKNCKENENKLLNEVKTLQKKLLALENQCQSLQLVFEKLGESNSEDPNSSNVVQLTALKALLEKSHLKEEYLENKVKQAKEENVELNNIVENLKAKIGGT